MGSAMSVKLSLRDQIQANAYHQIFLQEYLPEYGLKCIPNKMNLI